MKFVSQAALVISLLTLISVSSQGAILKSIRLNGLDFSYLEEGASAAPPIFMFHGFPDGADAFEPMMKPLADRGYRVIAPFMRGYAPTGIPKDNDFSPMALGNDVLAFVKHFSKQPAIVVGHDWGAIAAYTAANIEPQRISKLVTISIPHPGAVPIGPEFFRSSPHFLQLPWKGYSINIVRKDNFAFLDRLVRTWSPTWTDASGHSQQMKVAFQDPQRLEAALGYYRSFAMDALNLRRFRLYRKPTEVPTLVFRGMQDGATNIAWFQNMEKFFSGGHTLLSLPGGHFLQREQPAAVLDGIVRFISPIP